MSSKFITEVKQDATTEDYYIEIPDHILNTLKWKEGDEICWSVKEGKIILTKIRDSTESGEEPTMSDYDWYTVKEEAIKEYLESESEGKDFDQQYEAYLYSFSPEAEGSWDQGVKLTKERVVPPPSNFPHFP